MSYVNPENVSLLKKAIKSKEVTGKFLPSVYILDPSSVCNLKCVICPNSKIQKINYGFIDVELYKEIIDSISDTCEFLMLYWLGESLLHPHIESLLAYANKKIQGRVNLSTNLYITNDSILASLREYCDVVICSLDTFERKTYEKIRVGSDYTIVENNIKKLLTLPGKSKVIVKGLDLNFNYTKSQKEFHKKWRGLGASTMVSYVNDWVDGINISNSPRTLNSPYFLKKPSSCADLWFKMVINWRGEIQACCFDWNYSMTIGKYFKSKNWISKTWHSNLLKALRREQITTSHKIYRKCNTCKYPATDDEFDAYINFDEDSYFIIF